MIGANRAAATAVLAERFYEDARAGGELPPDAPPWAELAAPEKTLWLRAVAGGFESRPVSRLSRAAYWAAARGSRILRRMEAAAVRARKLLK